MSKIFSNSYNDTRAWSAAGALVQWGGGDVAGTASWPLLMQAITIQFNRQQTPMYPVNTVEGQMSKISLIGAPEGTLDCQGLLGPGVDVTALLKATGKACFRSGSPIWMSLTPFFNSCEGSGSEKSNQTWKLKGLILDSLSLSISGGAVSYVQQPLRFSFTDLEID